MWGIAGFRPDPWYANFHSRKRDNTPHRVDVGGRIVEVYFGPSDNMLGKLVNIIANSMNALFDDSAITSSAGSGLEAIRSDLRSAVTSWFDSEGPQFNTDFGIRFDFEKTEEGVFNTDFGIGFDFEKTEEGVFKFSPADRSRFENALASPQGVAAVHQALFGTESGGLFNQLHSSLTAAATGSESNANPTGLFVNLSI